MMDPTMMIKRRMMVLMGIMVILVSIMAFRFWLSKIMYNGQGIAL